MKKVNIDWKCPKCGKVHHWKWNENSFISGEIHMECENCKKRTLYHIDEFGNLSILPRSGKLQRNR